MDGKVQIVPIQSVTKRKINRNATALDSQNNNLNVGDIVNVIDGSFAVRIKKIYFCLNFLFFFWIFPVAGPFVAFGHTDLPQANYTAHYLGMRNHTLAAIPMDDIRGIISFPSFHVSSAIIMTWFLRRLRYVFSIAVLLNIGMSIGALVIGGHYLIDVIAGIGLGFVTIFVISRLEKGYPEMRLPFL